MKLHKPTLLLAEIRESFTMAMNALASHKLRSALTLLGVLIGVFSIIVVMTAMRVLKQNIESEISQLDVLRRFGIVTFLLLHFLFFYLVAALFRTREKNRRGLAFALLSHYAVSLSNPVHLGFPAVMLIGIAIGFMQLDKRPASQ